MHAEEIETHHSHPMFSAKKDTYCLCPPNESTLLEVGCGRKLALSCYWLKLGLRRLGLYHLVHFPNSELKCSYSHLVKMVVET